MNVLGVLCFIIPALLTAAQESDSASSNEVYRIEGKIYSHNEFPLSARYLVETKVIVNSGQYYGFLRPDGGFAVNGLAPGSYVIEVTNPNFFYEAVRVDISSKGKIRARKVNYIQVTEVKQMPYPLKFKARAPFKYFHIRETWRITDLLYNPMVLMMVVPLFLIMVLPKLVNQEELQQTQKELQNLPNLQNSALNDMPELSEMMANWLGKPNAAAGAGGAGGGQVEKQRNKKKNK